MNGIDISSWQSKLNLADLDIDFAILKLSEGRTWADPSFDAFYEQAKLSDQMQAAYGMTDV